MSADVSQIADILESSAVAYELGPMGTTVEGAWDDVMAAIKRCHEEMQRKHQRVLISITIDDDATRQPTIEEAKAKLKAAKQ
jgi:uncharacterized protein (TIGR00106 family)